MVQTGANPTPGWIKRYGRAHGLHSAPAEPRPGHRLHQEPFGSFETSLGSNGTEEKATERDL